MHWMTSGTVRLLASAALTLSLSACAMPRSGPTKSEIFAGSVENEGDAFVVPVTDQVASITSVEESLGFSSAFRNAGVLGSDVINPGDVLTLTIWENVDDGLLAGRAANATNLSQVQVDGTGFIFVPYAGRIKAAGNTPEAIRRIITEKLDAQTPDPQVLVGRAAGDGATVTLSGRIRGQGVYPIERPTRTLAAMVANAGGPSVEPELAQVKVMRGSRVERVWFEDLFSNPDYDIPLRNGDRILVEADPRTFTALGSTGGQRVVSFETRDLSALEAIAQIGGLNGGQADPTGIFVFRDEHEAKAKQVLARADLIGPQRMIYMLDLTEPNGIFLAREFLIRDEDTIYVTEAPFSQWSKVLRGISGTIGSANTIQNALD